jgi:hypothetical protein
VERKRGGGRGGVKGGECNNALVKIHPGAVWI